jgi:hypothetical protein
LKFYSGKIATTGTTAPLTGVCSLADGNNNGICVSATYLAGTSGYDVNAGT